MGHVQLKTSGTPSTVTVLVSGDVDTAAGDSLRGVLVDVIMRRRPHRFIIDLDGVTALDPAALGVLQAARATAGDIDLDVVFHTARSPICSQLDSDGIHDHGCRADL